MICNSTTVKLSLRKALYSVLDPLYLAFSLAGVLVAKLLPAGRKQTSPGATGVLIVFVNAIGDFVLFSSMLPALIDHYRGQRVTLAGYDRFAPLVPGLSGIDDFISIRRERFNRNPVYRYRLLTQLRRRHYRVALYPAYSRSELGDDLMRLIRADEKIAYDGDTNNISIRVKQRNNRMYTRLIPSSGEKVRELERYHHFACELGVAPALLASPRLRAGATDITTAGQLLSARGLNAGQPYALIAPSAASNLRIWSTEGYGAVCTWLHARGLICVLCGSHGDRELITAIAQTTTAPVIDLSGQTTLPQLVALCAEAELFVGGESGPLHIAAATGTPTLGIVGGGHPARFYPWVDTARQRVVNKTMDCYGCNWQCIYDQARCISEIEPAAVIEELTELLKTLGGPGRHA